MTKHLEIILGVAPRTADLVLMKSAVEATRNSFSAARNGTDCVQFLSRMTPRLIIIDTTDPELDGLVLCREIRALSRLKDMPILLLVADKTSEFVEAARAAGGNDFIAKPCGLTALSDRIQHWLRQSTVIMAVDDTPDNLGLAKYAAESAGYGFVGTSSGAECLELLNQVTPKLILLDVVMPEMNGFEVCRRIRALPQMKSVPIAFLTAEKTVEGVKAGVAAGGNDFILKPCIVAKLRERIAYWIGRQEVRPSTTR